MNNFSLDKFDRPTLTLPKNGKKLLLWLGVGLEEIGFQALNRELEPFRQHSLGQIETSSCNDMVSLTSKWLAEMCKKS